MSKTTMIFIRHGYSEANEQNVFAGNYNVHLTELGKEQARLMAEYLKDYKIDAIYSSDLYRALETAQPLAAQKKLPVIPNKGLREIDGGEWEEKVFTSLIQTYAEEFGAWMNDFENARCTNGESVQEVRKRVTAAVETIAAENAGKTVCVVTHATPLRVLCYDWLRKPFPEIPYVPNSSVTVVEYEGDKRRVRQLAYAGHLGSLTTRLPENV